MKADKSPSVALGAVVALRPVVTRRMVRKMRCKQMIAS